MDPWGAGKEDFAIRLVMRFDEREKRPIYYYSTNKNEVNALKNYCEFCIKKQSFVERKQNLTDQLEDLLAINYYTTMILPLNSFYELLGRLDAKSNRVGTFLGSLVKGLALLKENKKHILRAWAKAKVGKSVKNKPKTSLRVKAELKTVIQFKRPTESTILDASKTIREKYKKHIKYTDSVKRQEIESAVKKKKDGLDVKFIFSVHPEIMKYATGDLKIPKPHNKYTTFDFPKENIQEVYASMAIESSGSMIKITSEKFADVNAKEIKLGDISCIVLNDPPPNCSEGKIYWLRINGRKIKKELGKVIGLANQKNEIENEKVFLDPSNEFLARSIDSYLSKKTIIEFQINTAKFDSINPILKKFETDNVSFRIKINAGDLFWTSTPFVQHEEKPEGICIDFNQKFNIRVEYGKLDKIVISLWGCLAENNKLKDEFQALKTETFFGSTIVQLKNKIPKEAKIAWIPLNNGVCFEELTMDEDDAILSMSFKLIENKPGNYPEATMSGKNFIIGDMVYYNELVDLNYPVSRSEFALLGRKDIKYEDERAGKPGCPLRYPMNATEWELAKLERNLLGLLIF